MSSVAVKHFETNEVKNVFNVKVLSVEDRALVCNNPKVKDFGDRAMRSYADVLEKLGFTPDGFRVFRLKDGWEIDNAKAPRAPRKPREPKASEPTPAAVEPQQAQQQQKTMLEQFYDFKAKHHDAVLLSRCGDFYETYEEDAQVCSEVLGITLTKNASGIKMAGFPHHALDTYLPKLIRAGKRVAICNQLGNNVETVEPMKQSEPAPAPKAEPATTTAAPSNIDETAQAIANALKGLQVNAPSQSIDREELNELIQKEVERISEKVRRIEFVVKTPATTNVIKGTVNKDFKVHCNIVNAGKPLYLYGPAGCGKSYEAKQIAEALGLDYYETSQAMFAHELKGYGDAAGNFVPTAFYRAFAYGGLFFLDEVDASAPEALVVLNNAIANKRFDFPVIGNVEAHPNFRVVAAGNTRMTGATLEYTARQMQDTSFKNRFFFSVVTYDRDIMLAITGNDEEIVNFGADLRRAARETGISQLFSYRQAQDLATLQECCNNNDVYLLRGSVLQEKEVDDALNLYEHLQDKNNRWAKAMKQCIEEMKVEEVW